MPEMREEEVTLTRPYGWPPPSQPLEITCTVEGGELAAVEVERRQ